MFFKGRLNCKLNRCSMAMLIKHNAYRFMFAWLADNYIIFETNQLKCITI